MATENHLALQALLAADGQGGADLEPAWRDFVEHVVETLDVGPGTRVWEVGCGAGSFLYPLWENGYVVGGVDADADRIGHARAAMPEGHFEQGVPTALHPAEAWDVVLASRGLIGCGDVDQARGLLARMVAKATHAVALLNVAESGDGGELALDRADVLRMLAEIGVTAVQFEDGGSGRFAVYAKV